MSDGEIGCSRSAPELLSQPHCGATIVEVTKAHVERALPARARLEMERHQQQVEVGITAGGADRIDQLL